MIQNSNTVVALVNKIEELGLDYDRMPTSGQKTFDEILELMPRLPMWYHDTETDEYLTTDMLEQEYIELKESGDTEAATFNDYMRNCLEGTLERI